MLGKLAYSTVEICQMFDISKSTIFRWEKQRILPKVDRDETGQRIYTRKHFEAISQQLMQRLAQEFNRAASDEDTRNMAKLHEAMALQKFLSGDMLGLSELAEQKSLSGETISRLLHFLVEQRYEPGDERFCRIAQVIYEQSCKLGNRMLK